MGRIGIGELILVLVIALVVFGPAKLPEESEKQSARGSGSSKTPLRGLMELRMRKRKLLND